MQYAPLIRFNPTLSNINADSSAWLCSRLMVGRGRLGVSVPDYQTINGISMRHVESVDIRNAIQGLLAVNPNTNLIVTLGSSGISGMVYKGLWVANDNHPVIGMSNATGLTTPFNTYNVGLRYKNGWRPSI